MVLHGFTRDSTDSAFRLLRQRVEEGAGGHVGEIQHVPFGPLGDHAGSEDRGYFRRVIRVEHRSEIVGRRVATGAHEADLAQRHTQYERPALHVQRQQPDEPLAVENAADAQIVRAAVVLPPRRLPLPGEKTDTLCDCSTNSFHCGCNGRHDASVVNSLTVNTMRTLTRQIVVAAEPGGVTARYRQPGAAVGCRAASLFLRWLA